MPNFIPNPAIDAFFARLAARVVHKDGDEAYCSWGTDHIQLLPPEKQGTDFYYTLVFHEHAHWTGHRTRLGRVVGQPEGSKAYAREEIVAITAELHLSFRFGVLGALDPSLAYGKKFYERLKDDPALIRAAMVDGRRAVLYMHELQGVPVPHHALSPWAEKLLAEHFPLPPEETPVAHVPRSAPLIPELIAAPPTVRDRLAPLIARFGTGPRNRAFA